MLISLACRAGAVAGAAGDHRKVSYRSRLDRVARSPLGDRAQPEGPNRSTRITPSGTPASRRRSVAASANAGEPQTKTSWSARAHQRRHVVDGHAPRPAGVARRRRAGPHDARPRRRAARRRSRGRSGLRADTSNRSRSACPSRRAWRSIAISGTTPDPPPTSRAGRSPCHTNSRRSVRGPPARRPAATTSCRNAETSPSSSRSTVSSISPVPSGARRDRVRAGGGVAVGGGEPHDVVLARRGGGAARAGEPSRNVLRGRASRRAPSQHRAPSASAACGVRAVSRPTVVSRPGSAARARGRRGRGSRCAPRSPGSSWSSRRSPATHFALFQKYRCGTSRRAGPPCSAASGWPSCVPDDPRLAAGDVGQREVGGVAGVARRRRRGWRRAAARRVEQRVDGDAVEASCRASTTW